MTARATTKEPVFRAIERTAAEQRVLEAADNLVRQHDTGDGINRDFYDALDRLRSAVIARREGK